MSEANPDDVYASDEYEPESPAHSPLSSSHSHQSVDPSPASQTQQLDANVPNDDDSKSEAKFKRSRSSREFDRVPSRHLLDNTPWTFIVSALQVRMLRIPVADSAAIRELRVFASIDKHAAQSQGSKWKHELRFARDDSQLRLTQKQKYRSKFQRRVQPYRRSGLIEEAKWLRGDGQLQWTFPMEKFRRLKAYSPRIKAFVYGLKEAGGSTTSRTPVQTLVHQEKQGLILSFGWFFLDLRTPDLPERWMKLQNSLFGGEILISSTFLPVEISPEQTMHPINTLMARLQDTRTLSIIETEAVPAMVTGESKDFLQIGDGSGQDIFVLSIFIQAAFNLFKVVETVSVGENRPPSEGTGYWLSYSLFDVVVQTDIFFNLSVAEFSSIRDSFRVKTSVKELSRCLEGLGSLTVFLCTENRVLAGVVIPLTPLITKGLFAKPINDENNLKVGDLSDINGEFSFPDFDDAFISASVAVELVEKNTLTDNFQHNSPKSKAKEENETEAQAHMTVKDDDEANRSVIPKDLVLFKLDYLRLRNSALSPFIGNESACIELSVGDTKAVGILEFCSYTHKEAFATCEALDVVAENLVRHTALDTAIHVRCFSSVSNTLIAESSEAANIICDENGYPRSIVFQLQNESQQTVGRCTLSSLREPQVHQKLHCDLLCDASKDKCHYQCCLKLKSIRDFHIIGKYSLRYQNPFLHSALVTSDWFSGKDTGELVTINFYCIFDLIKNPLQLKQLMQESVNIDLISSDEEIVGRAVFSLSYLYFSEEHYCCSEESCKEIFLNRADTEAHWLEVHTELSLPDTQAGSKAYSHSYRSCSINIPIVSHGSRNCLDGQQSKCLGSIRLSANLEDTGLLAEKGASAQKTVLAFPRLPLHDNAHLYGETQAEAELMEAGTTRSKQEQLTSASVLQEAKESSRSPPACKRPPRIEVAGSKSGLSGQEVRLRARETEALQFQEVFEQETSAWKHEQHLQQLQWKRRFAEMEKSRMDELEEEWARREEERSNLLKSAQEEYQQLEQTLRKSLADLEMRERQFAVAEAALQREQEVKRDENECLQRRLRNEHGHTLALMKKQTKAYERRIALLESQLSDAERRAKQVEADFTEYRQQQRKLPESKLREDIAALRGNVSELEKQILVKERQCEVAMARVETMKAKIDQMAGLLTQERKKHEARVVDELEKLRLKYIAREEKYVLDGDRNELRAIKQQLDDLKGFKRRGEYGKNRSHKQRLHESSLRGNRSHTQKRQTAVMQQPCSSSESNNSFHSDHAYEHGSFHNTSLNIQSRRASTFSQSETHELRSERKDSCSSSNVDNHTGSVATKKGDEQGKLRSRKDFDIAPSGTELGRLLCERKLLLASGAYDTQSYLVRELDRLISITRTHSEHEELVKNQPT